MKFVPYTTIIYTKKNHIAHITLNRPEANNIINQQLAQELEDVCCQINQDDNIYVVMITGAGDRAFCCGSELEQLLQGSNTVTASRAKLKDIGGKYSAATATASVDRAVIAAINGDALGQGLELTLEQGLRLEADLYFLLHTTADRTEGIKAFLQKRPPQFKGAVSFRVTSI